MPKLALFCKSFAQDIDRAINLCRSIDKHNIDSCPIYFAVPPSDYLEFKNRLPTSAQVVVEDAFIQPSVNKKLPGWREQQVVKMMFGIVCDSDYYLVIDSDCEFIKDFKISDFIPETGIPLVCTKNYYRYRPGNSFSESASLGKLAPEGLPRNTVRFASNGMFAIDRRMIGHKDLISKRPSDVSGLIPAVFGRTDRHDVFFMPTPILFSKAVIRHFWIFLRDNELSFSDLILYSPWEAIWYGHYATTRFCDSIEFVEPWAMHFISDDDIDAAKKIGVSRDTLKSNFLAVTLASRHQESVRF